MWTPTLRYLIPAAALSVVAAFALVAMAKEKNIVKEPTDKPAANSPLQYTVKDIDGKDVNLGDYKGKVVLIVNVASKCGNTPQYEGLEAMYEKYKEQGLVIVGFPANDFLSQEPGTDSQIKKFCTDNYKVTFPMMSKITVKGKDKAPVYKFLTEPASAGDLAGEVSWNFGKFLVDRNGALIGRFDPGTKPEDPRVVAGVEKALAAKAAK